MAVETGNDSTAQVIARKQAEGVARGGTSGATVARRLAGLLGVGLAARHTGAQVETLTASLTAFTRSRNACNPLKHSRLERMCA